MNKRYKFNLSMVIMCLLLSIGISGCGDSSNAEADDSVLQADTEVSAIASTVNSIAQPELDDGELVVGSDSGQIGSFEGTLPQEQPDWDKIMADNPDTVAVMTIPETDVVLAPVTAGTSDATGIYVGDGNSTDFSDPVTVLKNVSGAGVYGDAEFFGNNPYIYIYQQGIVSEYRVYAAVEGNIDNLLVKYNMYDYNEYGTFIDDIFATRSIGASFDDSMIDSAKNSWQTVILSTGDSSALNVYCTLTGSSAS